MVSEIKKIKNQVEKKKGESEMNYQQFRGTPSEMAKVLAESENCKDFLETHNISEIDIIASLARVKNLRSYLKKQNFYKWQRTCILYGLIYVLKAIKQMEPEEEYDYLSDIDNILNEVKCISWEERKWNLDNDGALKLCVGIIEKYVEGYWVSESDKNIIEYLFQYNERNSKKLLQTIQREYVLNQSRIDPNSKMSALRQIIRKYPDERLNDIDYLFKKQA